MKITKKQDGSTLEVALEGRLDTASAPELENDLKDILSSIRELTMDFSKVEYVSSAGLRVLLLIQRGLHFGGTMKIIHANEVVREVFEVTGISNNIPIEP